MMSLLRKHFWEIALNSFALIIFSLVFYRLTQSPLGNIDPNGWGIIPRFRTSQIIGSPIFRDAGDWAIRFLLMSLAMSPIYAYFDWKPALRLRKPAGLWAFAFASLHV